MFKYLMTAAALKAFSTSPRTKRMYRQLGNKLGQKRRIRYGLSRKYIDRAKRMLELCEKHQAIQPGDRLLEIGTGWIHWESTIIRLFYDVEITLFDVWDNRQLEAYKHSFGQLDAIIEQEIDMNAEQRERVHGLLQSITKAASFEEIYDLLGFQYVIDPTGTLKQFQDGYFAAIYSCNVLEHVDRSILPEFVRDFHRLLKPGGYSIHQIDPGDHLAYYDRSVCLKNYLRYSDRMWQRYFENDVQYFNRVQRSDWIRLYNEAGFELIEEESTLTDISTIKVNKSYANLCEQDLKCITLQVVHRKKHEET